MNVDDLFEEREQRRWDRAQSRMSMPRSGSELSAASRASLERVAERGHPRLTLAVQEGWTSIKEDGELAGAPDGALDALFQDFEGMSATRRRKTVWTVISKLGRDGLLVEPVKPVKLPGPCERCGGPIDSKNHLARFCSNACRQATYRGRLEADAEADAAARYEAAYEAAHDDREA